jgi:hypothetical protein
MPFPPTPPHRVHGLKPDCDFNLPPLDGSLTVPEVFDFHFEHNPGYPIFTYYADKSGQLVNVPYRDFVPAAHRAARLIAESAEIDIHAIDPQKAPVVTILADSGISFAICFSTP